jgi:predicted DNA-binding protein (MmcQ/YjbR family)
VEAPQIEVEEDIVEQVHAICRALPEVTERVDFPRVRTRSTAWSFDVRRRSFCMLVASEGTTGRPETIIVLRADPDERRALLSGGHPYYTSRAGEDRVEVQINDDTDWDEIAELIKESYRVLAPKKLVALLD